jgi:hypothetical protein
VGKRRAGIIGTWTIGASVEQYGPFVIGEAGASRIWRIGLA